MCGFKIRFYRWASILMLFSIIFCTCKSAPKNSAVNETDEAVPLTGEVYAEDYEEIRPEPSAAQIQGAQPQTAVYGDLLDIVWRLYEIRISYGKTVFDRQAMAENGMDDIYTLQLTEEGLNGKAAPNLYRSTYELRHNHDFRLRPIVGTLMAANINIGGILESEYYWYLQHTTHWEIVNNGLELYAYPSQNEEIVMRYMRQ
ncbi:MAG: META domain-containing protein [Spirochaetaceae bacterium]|nr:META domain-containing protein [Spirochaetaceae bacterium]